MPPNCSRRPATRFGKLGIGVAPKLDLKAMMAFKDEGVDGNVKGVDFLLKKNKIDAFHGAGAHRRARQGRGERRRRQDADARDQVDRHRHRLRRGAAQGHRDRREAHRLLDRRAVAAGSAEASVRRRRRRDRAGARLGLAPARRAGHGGRIPRRHAARHGRRSAQAGAAPVREAGHDVQAVVQGHGGR